MIGPLLGVVWAGALTPLAADSIRQDGQIQIPLYTGLVNQDWTRTLGEKKETAPDKMSKSDTDEIALYKFQSGVNRIHSTISTQCSCR